MLRAIPGGVVAERSRQREDLVTARAAARRGGERVPVSMRDMLLRAWQTGVDESRASEYETFASERSLPMFHRHEGLLGVLLLAPAPGRRLVLTAWRDAVAVRALEASEDYRSTVDAITRAGFLRPPQSVSVFELDP